MVIERTDHWECPVCLMVLDTGVINFELESHMSSHGIAQMNYKTNYYNDSDIKVRETLIDGREMILDPHQRYSFSTMASPSYIDSQIEE